MKLIHTITAASRGCRTSPHEATPWKPARALARQAMRFLIAIGVATIAPSGEAQIPQLWTTIDDMFPAARADDVAADSLGNIFVSGYARDESGVTHAIVMKSGDQGETWDSDPATADFEEPSDDYISAAGSEARFDTMAIDSICIPIGENSFEEHLVTLGQAEGSKWLVRRSTDAGANWNTLDLFAHPNPRYVLSQQPQLALNNSGDIYVAGTAAETIVTYKGKTATTTTVEHKLIRKFEAASGLWTTTDRTFPIQTIVCIGNDVFVAGGAGGYWEVRKSIDGGSTWTVLNTYRYDANTTLMIPTGIAADSMGNLYVVGFGQRVTTSGRRNSYTSVAEMKWLVRKGTAGGTSWQTVGEFGTTSNVWNMARGVAIDRNNDVHVTGFHQPPGPNHWVTRQLSAVTGLWTTTDDFNLVPGFWAEGCTIVADPFGNVFATGLGSDGVAGHGWLVRRKLAP